MPQQELFFTQKAGDREIKVVKTYDQSYAREVFNVIDEEGYNALAKALEIEKNYDLGDIPPQDGSDYEDFLWEELCSAAREDVRQSPILFSFFVVSEIMNGKSEDLYISPDWPSAEAFARACLSPIH